MPLQKVVAPLQKAHFSSRRPAMAAPPCEEGEGASAWPDTLPRDEEDVLDFGALDARRLDEDTLPRDEEARSMPGASTSRGCPADIPEVEMRSMPGVSMPRSCPDDIPQVEVRSMPPGGVPTGVYIEHLKFLRESREAGDEGAYWQRVDDMEAAGYKIYNSADVVMRRAHFYAESFANPRISSSRSAPPCPAPNPDMILNEFGNWVPIDRPPCNLTEEDLMDMLE